MSIIKFLLYSCTAFILIGICLAVDVQRLSSVPPNTMIFRYSIVSSSLVGYRTPVQFENLNKSPLMTLKAQTIRKFEPLDNPRVYPVVSPSLNPAVHATFEQSNSNPNSLQLQIYSEPISFSAFNSDVCKFNFELKRFFNSLAQNEGNSFLFNPYKQNGLTVSSPTRVSYKPRVSFSVKSQLAYPVLKNIISFVSNARRIYPEVSWINQKDADLLIQIVQYLEMKKFPPVLSLFTFFMIQYSVLGSMAPQCQVNVVSDISRLVHFNSDLNKFFKVQLLSSFKNEQELTTFVVDNLIEFYSKTRMNMNLCESKLFFAKKLGKQEYPFSITSSLKELFQGKTFPLQNINDNDMNIDTLNTDGQSVVLTLNFFSEAIYDINVANGNGALNLASMMPSLYLITTPSGNPNDVRVCLDKEVKLYSNGLKIPLGNDYLNRRVSTINSNIAVATALANPEYKEVISLSPKKVNRVRENNPLEKNERKEQTVSKKIKIRKTTTPKKHKSQEKKERKPNKNKVAKRMSNCKCQIEKIEHVQKKGKKVKRISFAIDLE